MGDLWGLRATHGLGIHPVADTRNVCLGCWSVPAWGLCYEPEKDGALGDKGLCGKTCPIPLSKGVATSEELEEERLRTVLPY